VAGKAEGTSGSGTAFDRYERDLWAGRGDAYQRSFAQLCAFPAGQLLDAARVRAGGRVLDVGTGPGTVAALAYSRGATVTAVDAEPTMLRLAAGNAPHARLCQALLPRLPFADASCDAAVANFVLNHVGDPASAVAELRRVVRPGGHVAATIWPHPPPPLQQLWGRVFDAAGGQHPASTPTVAADKDFPRTREGFARLLGDQGLTDVDCRTIAWTHQADPEDWWSGPANGVGGFGFLLRGQTPAMVRQIKHAYDEIAAGHLTGNGLLALPTAALLASARVPPGDSRAG
jgi:SAM-dependent methyltransferase